MLEPESGKIWPICTFRVYSYTEAMRVAVMNLQFGVGTTKGYWQYATTGWKYSLPHSVRYIEEAADILKNESVDIAMCTEISAESFRSNFVSQAESLKEASTMKYGHFFPGVSSNLWNEGNTLLSQCEMFETKIHKLTGGVVPRILGEASVKIDNRTITIFVAHLAMGRTARDNQVQEIIDIVSKKDGSIILGGDFNERDSSHFKDILGGTFKHICELPTYPSWRPKYSLQRLLFNDAFILEQQHVSDFPRFSDHSALIVDMALR